jgi:hypothetical protein
MPLLAALIPFLTGGVGAIVAQFVRIFAVEGLKYMAWRGFLYFIVFMALPVVIYNVASDLIFDLMAYAVGAVGDAGLSPVIVQITGLGGWIGQQINLESSMAIIMSAVATRFALSFIPFWGR